MRYHDVIVDCGVIGDSRCDKRQTSSLYSLILLCVEYLETSERGTDNDRRAINARALKRSMIPVCVDLACSAVLNGRSRTARLLLRWHWYSMLRGLQV